MSCSGSEGWALGLSGEACSREVHSIAMASGGKMSRRDRRWLVRQQFSPHCSYFRHEPGRRGQGVGRRYGGLEEKGDPGRRKTLCGGWGNNVRGPSFPRISEDTSCWKKKKPLHPKRNLLTGKREMLQYLTLFKVAACRMKTISGHSNVCPFTFKSFLQQSHTHHFF